MSDEHIENLKQKIVAIGSLLWEKDLASGLNGNISVRIDEEKILLTAHNACLGLLQEKDILLMKINGELLDEGKVSTEKLLHTEIYQNFSETQAVIHTHTTYTNAFFLRQDKLMPQIFEAKVYLGNITCVPQFTPAVTNAAPVIDALKRNNIAVLKNHGVVAMGQELFDCFLLIQVLEDAVKIDILSRLTGNQNHLSHDQTVKTDQGTQPRNQKFKLFSQKQMDNIVQLVNSDAQMKALGVQTDMTMDLAIKLDETGQTYSFAFRKGKIENVGHDDKAEFLITASEKVWRAVFNKELDPFVATTQKKMHLQGDFAKISKWYAPCSRVFELWQQVPVE